MKLSQILNALEEGKTVYYQLPASGSKRFHKLLHLDGEKFIAQWWEGNPDKIDVSRSVVFDLRDIFEVAI